AVRLVKIGLGGIGMRERPPRLGAVQRLNNRREIELPGLVWRQFLDDRHIVGRLDLDTKTAYDPNSAVRTIDWRRGAAPFEIASEQIASPIARWRYIDLAIGRIGRAPDERLEAGLQPQTVAARAIRIGVALGQLDRVGIPAPDIIVEQQVSFVALDIRHDSYVRTRQARKRNQF